MNKLTPLLSSFIFLIFVLIQFLVIGDVFIGIWTYDLLEICYYSNYFWLGGSTVNYILDKLSV